MNQLNYKFAYGAICLTTEWEQKKKDFFEFCMKNSEKYRNDRAFASYMFGEYIDTDIPITFRVYNLDADNQRLVLMYIEEMTRDFADLYLAVPHDLNLKTMDRNLNIVKEFTEPVIVDEGDHTIIWARLRDFEGDVGISIRKPRNLSGQRYDGIVVTPDCALLKISGGMEVIEMISERLGDYAEKTFGKQ
jgi:hypothetical protein